MSITFRIATPADDKVGPIVTINARQLAAFRSCLRKEGERIGAILLDTDGADDAYLSYHFEARVCPLALASIATVFDFATDVIAVVEEAQFRARRVSVYRSEPAGTINMRVALTSDLGLQLDLASSNAYALLESLGLRPTASVKSRSTRSANGLPTRPCCAAPHKTAPPATSTGSTSYSAPPPAPKPAGWNGPSLRSSRPKGSARQSLACPFLSAWTNDSAVFRPSRSLFLVAASARARRSPLQMASRRALIDRIEETERPPNNSRALGAGRGW